MERKSMSWGFVVAVAVTIALASGGVAAAQENTSYGDGALQSNTIGADNSAFGFDALTANTAGSQNTATGANALSSSVRGDNNTATGFNALHKDLNGGGNTATGTYSLFNNQGIDNTAVGAGALLNNSDGYFNVAIGWHALISQVFGVNNIAIGIGAGGNLTISRNNIDIGNNGAPADSDTIRIGENGVQNATYIAGIGAGVVGDDVVYNINTGQLGIVISSARYKHDIRDMGEASSKLLKLRPVSFRYNNDPAGTVQYGLVAEEVEKVYPELVTYGADGKVETVRYSMLTGMLLNELQKQAMRIKAQDERNARQAEQIKSLSAQVAENKALRTVFAERLSALEQTVRVNAAMLKAKPLEASRRDNRHAALAVVHSATLVP